MSMAHVSKIAHSYAHLKPVPQSKSKHKKNHFSAIGISSIIDMRALGMTFKECDKHFDRGENCCSGVVFRHKLYDAIEARKMELDWALI